MRLCRACGKAVDEHHFYYYDPDKESYCSVECFQVVIKRLKEEQTRQYLYDTVKDIFHVAFPTTRMLGEIKRFKEKEGISYKQQALTLYYIYEIKQYARAGETLYLIPNYVKEAAEYYAGLRALMAEAEHAKERDEELREQATVVKPNYTQQPARKIKEISADEI